MAGRTYAKGGGAFVQSVPYFNLIIDQSSWRDSNCAEHKAWRWQKGCRKGISMKIIGIIILLASASIAFAQNPTATPFAGFNDDPMAKKGAQPSASNSGPMHGSALDQPAQGNAAKPINDFELVKATYGVPGCPLQTVTTKLFKILSQADISSENKVSLVVSEALVYNQ